MLGYNVHVKIARIPANSDDCKKKKNLHRRNRKRNDIDIGNSDFFFFCYCSMLSFNISPISPKFTWIFRVSREIILIVKHTNRVATIKFRRNVMDNNGYVRFWNFSFENNIFSHIYMENKIMLKNHEKLHFTYIQEWPINCIPYWHNKQKQKSSQKMPTWTPWNLH